jgi:hypothetical protein
MSVHARFSLTEVARVWYWREPHTATRVKLQAVQGPPFGNSTPVGGMEMTIVNPEAEKVFQDASIGQQFDVIISPTKKEGA